MAGGREEKCGTCRFWSTAGIDGDGDVCEDGNPSGNHGNQGECRIRAPLLVLAFDQVRRIERDRWPSEGYIPENTTGSIRIWPHTFAWDWCGEWQARPAQPGTDGVRD
jgi:hypothetical protein